MKAINFCCCGTLKCVHGIILCRPNGFLDRNGTSKNSLKEEIVTRQGKRGS